MAEIAALNVHSVRGIVLLISVLDMKTCESSWVLDQAWASKLEGWVTEAIREQKFWGLASKVGLA